ncbi:MAG: cupredoxin domain-containing protein [Nanoarchaeota archaeon]|nr:cupredoxin domain-containing protein [Nanoarchaeota archaeon]
MKNTTLGIILILTVILTGYLISSSDTINSIGTNTITGNVINNNDLIQKVVLSEKDLNYYPQEIRVKANQPVSLSLDDKVKGCLRSFTIRDLGISKYLKAVTDTIEFTPTKKGTFVFSCSMGMGYGKLIVE